MTAGATAWAVAGLILAVAIVAAVLAVCLANFIDRPRDGGFCVTRRKRAGR